MRSRRSVMLAVAAALVLVLAVAPQATGRQKDVTDGRSAPRVMAGGVPLRLDPAPVFSEGVLLVPVRPVAERLGATVSVRTDPDRKRAIILVKDGRKTELAIGSKTMTVNGVKVPLPAAPIVRGGAAMVPLRAVAEALGESVVWEPGANIAHIGRAPELPAVGTVEKLGEILTAAENAAPYRTDVVFKSTELMSFAGSADSSGSSMSQPNAPDYSRTNVQVEGVDEADWAKTDGRFIYQIIDNRVLIADIRNPAEPRLAGILDYAADENRFRPAELYVSDGRLVVIGRAYRQADSQTHGGEAASPDIAAKARDIMIWPPIRDLSFTSAKVYALDEDGKAGLERELEIEGGYVTSRMIGGALYLVSSKSGYSFAAESGDAEIRPQDFEPAWRDTAVSNETLTIPLARLRYFPDSPEIGMLLIGAVDLDDAGSGMRVEAYLGSAGTVYASAENLYIAVPRYVWPENGSGRKDRRVEPRLETDLYKFRLDGGSAVYAGSGTVPGHVLNQFSMDEYDGHFRIATTSGRMWAEGDEISKNNLYVLDEWLTTVGSLEDLAPGERIYSVRFMGKRAYMVTFRQVDPLFAIDLSDPERPAVLGQLKIPGYSDYLHPYDENHLIGFGKETVAGAEQDGEPLAYELGLKISLFDVTDASQPKEKFKEVIGDRGTYSEVLHNHKALLFDRSRGLMAFPVDYAEVKSGMPWDGYGSPPFGEITYQGAWVYQIDPKKGFTFKGRITHLPEEDPAKSGMYAYDYTCAVRRILYVGDTLYTLSAAMLKANDLNTLAERGSLHYPARAELYSSSP